MNHLDDKNHDAPTPPEKAGELSSVQSPRRRKLLRGAAIGTPALLALKSTPVMACNCKLPSGFSASGNLSRTGTKNCAAPCSKPSTWKGSTYQYNKTDRCYNDKTTIKTTTAFKDCGFSISKFSSGDSCDTVLGRGDRDIAALMCAAYLESLRSAGTGFPNSTIVKNMWNFGVCGSGYTVSPGIVWKEDKVLQYLLYVTGQAV